MRGFIDFLLLFPRDMQLQACARISVDEALAHPWLATAQLVETSALYEPAVTSQVARTVPEPMSPHRADDAGADNDGWG